VEIVAADARLVEAAALEAAEAALTGESLPVAKEARTLPRETPLAERANMVHAGTHLVAGRGIAVVVATGLATEVGKIAQLTAAATEPRTPLERRLAQFGGGVSVAALVIFTLVIVVGLLRGLPAGDVVMVAVSQMVSLVPEGLPVALTVALAVGVQRMAAQGAVVRRLAAVETLGAVTVICTDKTGTLTRSELTATTVALPDGSELEVTGAGYAPEGRLRLAGREVTAADVPGLRALLEAAVLCNDAQLVPPDAHDPRWRALGDPTEAALLTLALKACLEPALVRQAWPRREEQPFDPASKVMITQHGPGTPGRVCLKGAPEVVLRRCGSLRIAGSVVPLGPAFRASVERQAHALAGRALRVLALAEIPHGTVADAEAGGILLGLVAQRDPPRPEVMAAIAACRAAGIRAVMVTGDHRETALAVARGLGLAREGDLVLEGRELEAMPEQDLHERLGRIAVFARVMPAQKLRIVEALQAKGEVVAMTGDGVNDAPALARADVGVAMGLNGTDVAKGAAQMVLTDDSFATLVRAVAEGRLVHANLRKVLLFPFSTSLDELVVLGAALLLGYPLPLAAVQILWINLVTEGVLTVNLIMEPPEDDGMRRPPVPAGEPLVNAALLGRMALLVPTSVVVTLGFYHWRLGSGVPFVLVQSETFTVLAVCQWFNVLNCRSARASVFGPGVLRNLWLVAGLLLANGLQCAVIYAEPLGRLFHTVPIPPRDVLLIGGAASLVLWTEELRKAWVRRRPAPGPGEPGIP
jgi:magnesium-transporting ATPase (P-type)